MNVIFSDVFSFFFALFLGGVQKIPFFFLNQGKYNRDLDVFCVVTPIPLVVRSVRSVP